ncbi:NAD(P)-dependent oxidoreductase [Tateyamaria sp. SN3-11]|uniref:NAD(P)-dependent oxidoreductase n=1 Tax=Tateyamaria sp. SN3-11 TaxID=3092147 RepID=UPI0039E90DB3
MLGASGGCGQWVVRLAKERGHQVTAIVRPSSSYVAPDGVSLFREDVMANGFLERILPGHQAVISCLGMTLSKSGNPFLPLRSPPDLMSSTARRLCSAMPESGVQRVISISSGGVGDSAAQTNWLIRLFFNRSNIAISHGDLAKMEKLYANSGLDWLAVRPVTLKEGGPTGTAKAGVTYGLRSKITKGEVARLVVDAAEQRAPFSDHTPMFAGQ